MLVLFYLSLTKAAPISQEKFKHPGSAVFCNNYFTLLHSAANPLDSFTGEYNSDEEKKAAPYEEGKEAVNENHVEQFMQVSTYIVMQYSDIV